MKMNTYVYLFIPNSCIRHVALSCKRLCFISGMDVINDLCICVLHLKLWMLAMIQGLALQAQGSFSFTKEGSYSPLRICPYYKILNLGSLIEFISLIRYPNPTPFIYSLSFLTILW